MRSTLKTLLASTALLAVAAPAFAQDVALVIGNSDYANADDVTSREHDRLVDAYRAAGFDVTQGEDLTRTQLFSLLGGFMDEIDGAERIVVHLNGHTVTTDTESWFMPVDINGDSVVRIGLTAPTIDFFVSLVDEAEELGVVFVGSDEDGGFEGEGYEAGIGRLFAPRDTMVVTGSIADVSSLVRNTALEPGMTMREMGNDLPDDLNRFGFAPRDAVLAVERVEPAPLPAARPEPATVTPQPQPEVEENPAEAREQQLNLSRSERRQIQQNLVALGYNTRGVDGIFGPGSRSAIAAWQQSEDFTASGFLSRGQIDLLGVQADNARAEQEAAQAAEKAEREREDRAFWDATGASGEEAALRRYLDSFPNGVFAERARSELNAIEAENNRANANANVNAAWQRARNANTIEGYETFVANFPNSEFAATARAQIETLRASQETQQPDPAQDPQATEQALGLNSINRALVQIRLQSQGYPVGNISGSFDETTRQGLRQFQRDFGLNATGYVDQATVRQLITLAGN
ncbi:peptidoglycan-binding domain-containing protein [Pontivivens nitratireducens]|uniref:peptidoglycan-binding domain-containing protein n=1 Tax=Pontivivens nitratireducens TaxID=2758038 RepID=UPI00163AA304|nr:peptidoglycan-binding protein [Pontibrevibacter nitratireducens]